MKKGNAIKYFIIDFDSTFVKSEGLDELAEISLKKNPEKNKILEKIKEITNLGMEGRISFAESLKSRLKLLEGNKLHIDQVVRVLKKKVSVSIKRNKQFFKQYKDTIYIISGGFREFILPIIKPFALKKSHVFANTFILDKEGKIIGLDSKNPLAQDGGKVKVIRNLRLNGEITVVGDGYTDYQIKAMGVAKHFVAFTENVYREVVAKKADHIAPNFDEFLFVNNLPMSISYPKNRIKVLLLENINNQAVLNLEKEGYSVEYHSKALNDDDLREKLKEVRILGIRSRTKVSKKTLNFADKLLTIGAFCIGTDQIDLDSASKKGVAVFNAPYSNTRSVVELILGEIIMLARGIFDKSRQLHKGRWDKKVINSYEIRGKTLGIIGYGKIGSQLSVLAENLGMEVIFYDIAEKLPLGNSKKCLNLKEVLRNSDVITVHVDGNSKNINLIGEKEFKLMKDKALFLNASRGFVVDIKSLAANLRSGKLRGAAIDVFPEEPKERNDKFQSLLRGLPNVILTPHIGGSTVEAQKNIAEFVTRKIIDFIDTGNTNLSVNFPNIQPPELKNTHRLLHLHYNVPGILAQINGVLAKYKINILGQQLKTNDQVGYVITNVNKKYDKQVLTELKKISDTIRFRVLY